MLYDSDVMQEWLIKVLALRIPAGMKGSYFWKITFSMIYHFSSICHWQINSSINSEKKKFGSKIFFQRSSFREKLTFQRIGESIRQSSSRGSYKRTDKGTYGHNELQNISNSKISIFSEVTVIQTKPTESSWKRNLRQFSQYYQM